MQFELNFGFQGPGCRDSTNKYFPDLEIRVTLQGRVSPSKLRYESNLSCPLHPGEENMYILVLRSIRLYSRDLFLLRDFKI